MGLVFNVERVRYVCMCIYIYIYVCVCVCIYTHTHTCKSIYTNIHTHIHIHTKVVPLRCTEAHFGEKRYSSYSLLTSALEGGEWSASRPGRDLNPVEEPPVPIVQEAGWDPELVWTQRLEEKSSVGDRTQATQSAVRRYTD
jgi:hypothetical protein